jgi:hypothetical protein
LFSARFSRHESGHARVPPNSPQEMSLRLCLRLIVLSLAVSLTACSSFDRHWKEAATSRTAERWDGRWSSAKHITGSGAPVGGRLRAVTETAANGSMTARIHANWLAFASDYTMTFQPKGVARGGKRREFSGTHELSKMFGGTYRYEAVREGDHLTSRYHSSYDHGKFDLHRVTR